MSHSFSLPRPNAIHGDQLVAEVLAATGLDLTGRYGFAPPDAITVGQELTSEQVAQIQAVVDAHVPDPTPAVPVKVSTWRLHAVAEIAGLTAQIDAAIAAIPDAETRAVAHAGWHRSFETERGSVLLAQMTGALNLTSAEVDDLFRQAAALQA